jgi:OmpA-OmpF porin, OOP family
VFRTIFVIIYLFFMSLTVYAQVNMDFENPGKNINSSFAELMPLVSVDGKSLYFVRDGHPENNCFKKLKSGRAEHAQDIWYSELQSDSSWGVAKHFASPFNRNCVQSIVYISPDNNSLFMNDSKGFLISKKTKTGWSDFIAVEISELDEMWKGLYKTMAFAPNQKVIILSFSTKINAEVNDLFVSFLNKNNIWTKPKKLPITVNTKMDETCPFIAADGKTLYFASNRPGGIGSYDLYVTQRLDDKWMVWTESENLGSSFNSPDWDGYYSVDAKAKYAYMVTTNTADGSPDIVRKPLIQGISQTAGDTLKKDQIKTTAISPEKLVLLYGNVYNSKTKMPIEAKIDYQILGTGENVGIANSDPSDGAYKVVLNYGEKYGIFATAEGYISVADNIDLSQKENYQEIKKDLFLAPIEIGQVVNLKNIFFDTNKTELSIESYPELNRVVEALKNNANLEIEIDGHTDDIGQDDYNQQLSTGRAAAVYQYLLDKGISKSRLSYKGFGKTKPVDDNKTETGRQNNRRVEFIIIKK